MLLESVEVLVREEDEARFLDPWVTIERRPRRLEGDSRRPFDREAVDARRDRRERDGSAVELGGDLERASVARGEELVLGRVAALPDRAYGVNDVPRRPRGESLRRRLRRRAATRSLR